MIKYQTYGSIQLFLVIFGLLTAIAPQVNAQKVVQLEKRGKVKTTKFYQGDELYIRLLDEDYWRHTIIVDIHVEENTIEFDFGEAAIDEIDAIKTPKQNDLGKKVRNTLLIAAASFLIYAPVDIAYSSEPNWPLIAGGLGLAPLGLILKPIIDVLAKHKLGGRKRLRLLDLSLPEPGSRL